MAKIAYRKRKGVMSKRVNKYKSRTFRGKYQPKARMNIPKMVNKILAHKIETKKSVSTVSDGTEILHNNFIMVDNKDNFLRTTVGAGDPMTGTEISFFGPHLDRKYEKKVFFFENFN
jgi:hypothetical protein